MTQEQMEDDAPYGLIDWHSEDGPAPTQEMMRAAEIAVWNGFLAYRAEIANTAVLPEDPEDDALYGLIDWRSEELA